MRVANEADEGCVFRDRLTEAESGGEGLIAEENAHLMIDGEDAFGHAFEDEVAASGFEAEAVYEFVDAGGHAAEGLVEEGSFGGGVEDPRGLWRNFKWSSCLEYAFGKKFEALDVPVNGAGEEPGEDEGTGEGEG